MKQDKRLNAYLNSFRDVDKKTIIITGANSGLGFSATKHFASLGHQVVMACRNLTKAEEARKEILKRYPQADLVLLPYDQADFISIERFVKVIKKNYPKFDGLVLNAGVYHPKKGLLTAQGYPLTVGTNYLGVYYLLKQLSEAKLWNKKKEQRIIFVGSLSWYNVKVTNKKEFLTSFKSGPTSDYCRSKTAIGALSYYLSRHDPSSFIPESVKVYIMHPGVTSTNIVSSISSSFPSWFTKIAHYALYLFTHHPDIAALGIIKQMLDSNIKEDTILVPRGLFHISGYPKPIHYPKNLTRNILPLMTLTEEVIKEKKR